MRAHQHRPALWPGLLLVTVGAGLMARELGFLPAHVRLLDFWPLVVVILGVSVLLRAGGIVGALLALAFIGTGVVLLAGNLGFVTASVTRFWPALLVLFGLWTLFRNGQSHEGPEPEPQHDFADDLPPDDDAPSEEHANPHKLRQATDDDRLVRQYTLSGAELRIESQAWKGGELGVTAGGVELDLRHARLAPEGAVLHLRVLMGGVELRVPDTWNVQLDVIPFLGGADDSTRTTQGVSSAPRLRVIGNVTLGGVNISN